MAAPRKYDPEAHPAQVIEVLSRGGTLSEFCKLNSISWSAQYKWQKTHEEFAEAVEQGKAAKVSWWEERARDIVTGKVNGSGAATITIFMLKNYAPDDYRDKHEHEVDGNLTVNIVRFTDAQPEAESDDHG